MTRSYGATNYKAGEVIECRLDRAKGEISYVIHGDGGTRDMGPAFRDESLKDCELWPGVTTRYKGTIVELVDEYEHEKKEVAYVFGDDDDDDY